MTNELQRLINNLNQVEVKGKQNLLILADAITTLERLSAQPKPEEVLEDE